MSKTNYSPEIDKALSNREEAVNAYRAQLKNLEEQCRKNEEDRIRLEKEGRFMEAADLEISSSTLASKIAALRKTIDYALKNKKISEELIYSQWKPICDSYEKKLEGLHEASEKAFAEFEKALQEEFSTRVEFKYLGKRWDSFLYREAGTLKPRTPGIKDIRCRETIQDEFDSYSLRFSLKQISK